LTEADLDAEAECDEECFVVDISWLVEGFRSNAEKIMDLADDLAESFEKGLVNVMSVFDRSDDDDDDDVEDAEIVDEDDDDEESKGTE
jgi:hypothetical protein